MLNEYEFKTYALGEYVKIRTEDIKFPKIVCVAYAVCAKMCGNSEFIVDGQSQRCEKCGYLIFRTAIKKYRLVEYTLNCSKFKDDAMMLKPIKILKNDEINENYQISDYPEIDDDTVKFPEEIIINFSVCGNECGCTDFMVDGSTPVCQYCDHIMLPLAHKKYILME